MLGPESPIRQRAAVELGARIKAIRGGLTEIARRSGASRHTVRKVLLARGTVQAAKLRAVRKAAGILLYVSPRKVRKARTSWARLTADLTEAAKLDGAALLDAANLIALRSQDIVRQYRLPCVLHLEYDGRDMRRRLVMSHSGAPAFEICVLVRDGGITYERYMHDAASVTSRERHDSGQYDTSILKDGIVRMLKLRKSSSDTRPSIDMLCRKHAEVTR